MEILMNGRLKNVGDRLGEALVKMGKASLPPAPTLEPEPAAREMVQKVMKAESDTDQAPEISKVTGKPTRQYKRRDMKAEG